MVFPMHNRHVTKTYRIVKQLSCSNLSLHVTLIIVTNLFQVFVRNHIR